MSDKLSNCPFCGYHAQVTEGSGAFFGRVQVECASCRIATFWLEEDVARQLWNRRASPAPAIPAVTMSGQQILEIGRRHFKLGDKRAEAIFVEAVREAIDAARKGEKS
ncbi:hypothetical protein QZM99_00680 [Burkholderia gladioli]|uniref:Lar family restriction alleviation protein n=1 Tax=Burkholderia gladioli TaxID=28095 RepID=UPI002655826B|nr:Lar family restriction alleviation protein [Burkholderia gladioli]MDN7916606.1 hypothetical protein [Burkholderia gladioli]